MKKKKKKTNYGSNSVKGGRKKKSVLKKFKERAIFGFMVLLVGYLSIISKPVEAGKMVTMSARTRGFKH